MARVPKLQPDQWTDDVRAVLEPTLGPVAGLEGRAEGEQLVLTA